MLKIMNVDKFYEFGTYVHVNNIVFSFQWKSRWCVMRKLSPVAGMFFLIIKLCTFTFIMLFLYLVKFSIFP